MIDLAQQPIVHHYRCGWQEPEQRFIKGRAVICPKCRRELRHYGVDYDKPGSVLVCRSCQKAKPDPVVQFVCLDCANIVRLRRLRALIGIATNLRSTAKSASRGAGARKEFEKLLDRGSRIPVAGQANGRYQKRIS